MPEVATSREVEEVDALYTVLKDRECENKQLRDELQRSEQVSHQAQCVENVCIKQLQIENQGLKETLEDMKEKAKQQDAEIQKQKMDMLRKENELLSIIKDLNIKFEDRQSQQFMRDHHVTVLQAQTDHAIVEKKQAFMMLEISEGKIKGLEKKLKKLEDENNFLKSSQNDSTGAASSDVQQRLEDSESWPSEGIPVYVFDNRGQALRKSKRFNVKKITNVCRLCNSPIKEGEEFSECTYHQYKSVDAHSWKNIEKYKQYARKEEYKNYLYWPCCERFDRTTGDGCMRGLRHAMNSSECT